MWDVVLFIPENSSIAFPPGLQGISFKIPSHNFYGILGGKEKVSVFTSTALVELIKIINKIVDQIILRLALFI